MPSLEQLEAVARGAPPPPLDERDRTRIAGGRAVVEETVAGGVRRVDEDRSRAGEPAELALALRTGALVLA